MTTLGIFAKHWQPGTVKTRLAASIGHEAAAALHRRFVQTLVLRLDGVADRQLLCLSPSDAMEKFRELDLGNWILQPQTSGDLGSRMQEFFRGQILTSQDSRTILIGSDSPDLPLEFIREAFDKLREFPVALGPTEDGGYYLIGLSEVTPPIFENMPWSTPQLWQQTIARLEAARFPYHVLPQWYDVDDITGLERLQESLPFFPPQ